MSIVQDELQKLYDEHGFLQPEMIVEAARPKGHPLHERVFYGTMRDAAEAEYRERAWQLMKRVRIVTREATEDEEERTIRRYHALPTEAGIVYKAAEDIAADPFSRQLLLRTMEREWKRMFARYEDFEEFLEMVREDVKVAA